MNESLSIIEAEIIELESLDAIRTAAFQPVFESFKAILGENIYERAQEQEDLAQADMLRNMFRAESEWSVFVLKVSDANIGFVSIRTNPDTLVGEIGLNAISPQHASKGWGTKLYEFALHEMKSKGMKVATVATGGDPGHAPARRAYEKAGFDVQIPSVWYCKEL